MQGMKIRYDVVKIKKLPSTSVVTLASCAKNSKILVKLEDSFSKQKMVCEAFKNFFLVSYLLFHS